MKKVVEDVVMKNFATKISKIGAQTGRFLAATAFLFAALMFAFPTLAEAQIATSQSNNDARYQAGGQLNFTWAQPQGDFADHLDRLPAGATFLFGGKTPDMPLFLGTEIGVLSHGQQQFLEVPRLEDVPVQSMRVSSRNSIVMGHLVARVQLPTGPIRPYLDAMAGVRSYVSTVRVDSDVIIFPRGFSTRASTTDLGFSYGGGAGVDVVLHRGSSAFGHDPMNVSLNVGVRYLLGTEADFADPQSMREVDNRFHFETTRSRTNIFMPQIGIRVHN